jgi:hypothetical protein
MAAELPGDERVDRIGKIGANIFIAALAAFFAFGYLGHFFF